MIQYKNYTEEINKRIKEYKDIYGNDQSTGQVFGNLNLKLNDLIIYTATKLIIEDMDINKDPNEPLASNMEKFFLWMKVKEVFETEFKKEDLENKNLNPFELLKKLQEKGYTDIETALERLSTDKIFQNELKKEETVNSAFKLIEDISKQWGVNIKIRDKHIHKIEIGNFLLVKEFNKELDIENSNDKLIEIEKKVESNPIDVISKIKTIEPKFNF